MMIEDISRNDFMKSFWDYYIVLENDFCKTLRYVGLDRRNFGVFSMEYAKQLESIGAEIDIAFKAACEFDLDAHNKKIYHYTGILLEENNEIVGQEVVVKKADITLYPFKEFTGDKNEDWKIKWWNAYNGIKHNRIENQEKGNLENVITALAALFYLEHYIYKKRVLTHGINIFSQESKLFEIPGKHTTQRMLSDGTIVSF